MFVEQPLASPGSSKYLIKWEGLNSVKPSSSYVSLACLFNDIKVRIHGFRIEDSGIGILL